MAEPAAPRAAANASTISAGIDAALHRGTGLPPLPPLACEENIVVLPMSRAYPQPFWGDGGPVWPEFGQRTWRRFNRDGKPIDQPLLPPETEPAPLPGEWIWGGFAQSQFGHLIAEQLTRLPVALSHRPQLPALFMVRPEPAFRDPPQFFYDLCAWYGLPRERVRILHHPVRVEALHVAPQAEQLLDHPPAPYALALADRIAERNGITPQPHDVVYIGRMGMLAEPKAGHAGEAYLAGLLAQAGVTVLDPLRHSVRQQAEIYAGARSLIFAEGSAIHGRQLIGYRPQRITILNRRPGKRIGRAALTPRCDDLAYFEATATLLCVYPNGQPNLLSALSLYDTAQIFAAFARHGIDLAARWDEAAYQAAIRADARTWLAAQYRPHLKEEFWRRIARTRDEFTAIGWQDLFKDVIAGLPSERPSGTPLGRVRRRVGRILGD
ncbi:MAG: glycosyltransferase family 61 protein [Rhodobacteraceae bacterium]|nr:glycosyltransferase family 61 protein [Paracoccaceae bacterium]